MEVVDGGVDFLEVDTPQIVCQFGHDACFFAFAKGAAEGLDTSLQCCIVTKAHHTSHVTSHTRTQDPHNRHLPFPLTDTCCEGEKEGPGGGAINTPCAAAIMRSAAACAWEIMSCASACACSRV